MMSASEGVMEKQMQCPQERTIILYILYLADGNLSNTLKAYIASSPDTFEAKIVEKAAAMAAAMCSYCPKSQNHQKNI